MASELRGPGIAGTVTPREPGNGFALHLIVLYLFLEFVRPPFIWHFPKIIGIIVAIAWLAKAKKVISAQIVCFVLFVGILAVDILFAANSYDAVWTTYGMLVVLIGI